MTTSRCGLPVHHDIPGALTLSLLPLVVNVLFRAAGCRRLAKLTAWMWAWMTPLLLAVLAGFWLIEQHVVVRHGVIDELLLMGCLLLVLGGLIAVASTLLLGPLAIARWLFDAARDGTLSPFLATAPLLGVAMGFVAASKYGFPLGWHGLFDDAYPFYLATIPACLALNIASRLRARRASAPTLRTPVRARIRLAARSSPRCADTPSLRRGSCKPRPRPARCHVELPSRLQHDGAWRAA